ncbi:hypothetical protein APUTEX25_003725 [Auxenochlorella protothecoides]|uniref:Uncharacterized protein n=1 Tax=Auxenochlorella protothecoides TaxID=3075 RepID=A0A3M7KT70_AUXPR|nr:hypothetical protein APUTEX25_003725 [Auxenochlorella protothecoides]|eukprot:RMZ52582.1 hypothetical protein APUTEX25_003725 [Auxenochlorella protothecoides]
MTKAQEQRWRNCSDAPTPLTVVEALVEPSPVQAGKEAAFMIEYESGMEGHYSMLVSVREPETDRQLLCVEMDFSLSSWAGALSKPFSWLMGPQLGAQRADNHAAGAFVVDH